MRAHFILHVELGSNDVLRVVIGQVVIEHFQVYLQEPRRPIILAYPIIGNGSVWETLLIVEVGRLSLKVPIALGSAKLRAVIGFLGSMLTLRVLAYINHLPLF